MTVRYLDLGAEQRILLTRLEAGQNHLVSGSPGSGKSLLAVQKAALLELSGRPTDLIAHSKLLGQHLQAEADALGATVRILTYHRWIHDWYRSTTGISLGGARIGAFDWTMLVTAAMRHPGSYKGRALVIDEGQDLPPAFYQLCRLIGAEVVVFADECQRITENQSTLKEIAFSLGSCATHEFNVNRRNSRPIAELASHFYVGRLPPALPMRDGPVPVLQHRPDQRRRFIKWLADYAAAHRDHTIGIVLRTTKEQTNVLAEIERIHSGLRPQTISGKRKVNGTGGSTPGGRDRRS